MHACVCVHIYIYIYIYRATGSGGTRVAAGSWSVGLVGGDAPGGGPVGSRGVAGAAPAWPGRSLGRSWGRAGMPCGEAAGYRGPPVAPRRLLVGPPRVRPQSWKYYKNKRF